MIPAIGYMVGFYILTRMIELMARPNRQGIVTVFAIVTGVVTTLCLIALLSSEIGLTNKSLGLSP